MLIIDDLLLWLPAKGLTAVFKKIHELAEAELNDDSKLKEELLRYQTMFELDQINEAEYKVKEDEIIARLDAIYKPKKQQFSENFKAEEKLQSKGITKAVMFIKEMVGKEGDVVKATKTKDGWEVAVEVIEQSEYMKKIGIQKPVYDKNVYQVVLDQNFDLVSYERKGQKPSGGAAVE